MNNTDIRSLYGLKYNPFLPDLPPEALYAIPGTESFSLRMRSMAENGGFALITGEPGLGKSKTLQKIAHQLEPIPDLTVGVMQRPQSKLGETFTGKWENCSTSTCLLPIAMAASRLCGNGGNAIANRRC
jgi:general secretion pathway protein A